MAAKAYDLVRADEASWESHAARDGKLICGEKVARRVGGRYVSEPRVLQADSKVTPNCRTCADILAGEQGNPRPGSPEWTAMALYGHSQDDDEPMMGDGDPDFPGGIGCPVEGCDSLWASDESLRRHLSDFHDTTLCKKCDVFAATRRDFYCQQCVEFMHWQFVEA